MPKSLFPYCVPVLGAYRAPLSYLTEAKVRDIKSSTWTLQMVRCRHSVF